MFKYKEFDLLKLQFYQIYLRLIIRMKYFFIRFKRVTLTGDQLVACYTLGYRDFSYTVIQHANLKGANLNCANFFNAKLDYSNFENTDLKGCNFKWARLHGINFKNSNLTQADFDGADLSDSTLLFAILTQTNFTNSNLQRTNFIGSERSLTKFERADIDSADIIFNRNKRPQLPLSLKNQEESNVAIKYKQVLFFFSQLRLQAFNKKTKNILELNHDLFQHIIKFLTIKDRCACYYSYQLNNF